MELYPPTGPFLINTALFGIPIQVRWYGVLIVAGALLGGWFAARRAEQRGYDPEHAWNQLMLGMILGIIGARAYYVIFEWPRFASQSLLFIINPANGGLAIHGALIGAILSAVIYARRAGLPLAEWIDICLVTFLPAQAIGRWGNFFNQEAYGRPTDLGFGVRIDAEHRLPPYDNLAAYPANTLFHATFLYESIWNIAGFGLILWLERRLRQRGWLRVFDVSLFYLIWYGLGRLWVEGLRTDSLCTNLVGGECVGSLRTAQVVSLLLIVGGLAALVINHMRRLPPATPAAAVATTPPPGDTPEEAPHGA